MNILDVVNSDNNLSNYYQVILKLCSDNNYSLQLEYKLPADPIPNLGYFSDNINHGVIKVSAELDFNDQISCIAHELAHVELVLNPNIEQNLSSFGDDLNNYIDKVYFDGHFITR
ncbi:hypothetical protein [Acinetobacter sp. ANC 4173]|uniref:hypothetical protein n=1 Tax=Acinetobacter sp. ANC 4173 TaxID=2529837 RepID=UPI00103E2718|nr:hypothetical protein [Acinetobacter sp. ANC 4173]TCB79529.1 hypothetical protein E0H94_10000 [Acinetobacter sp. ANC 4173]